MLCVNHLTGTYMFREINDPVIKNVLIQSDLIEAHVNTDTPFLVYVRKSQPCAYTELEHLGFPKIGTAMFLTGNTLSSKVTRWLAENWQTNTAITKWLVSVVARWERGEKFSLSAGSKAAKDILTGILFYIRDNRVTFYHLISVFEENLTLAGTKVPELSRAFDKMSYQERQALLKANHQRVEEIPKEAL